MCDEGKASHQSRAIDIVLHEYDSLRAEIVSRMDARFQLIGFLAIVATLLGTTDISNVSRRLLIIAALILFISVWLLFGFYIKRCAKRLREIEAEVNKKLGDDVLVWESRRLPRGRFLFNFIR
jgi:uncharacterized membrane protein (DUF485 family)